MGSALNFDGSNDYVATSNTNINFITALNQPHSVFAWVYPRDVSTSQAIWSYGEFNDSAYTTALGISSNQLVWYQDGTATIISSGLAVPANQWSYVGFVRYASTMQFFVNSLTSTVNNTYPSAIAGDPFLIGATSRNSTPQNFFNGRIDQVRVYNYSRTSAQVAWEYNQGAPVGWWSLNEGQGSIAHDETANRNDGTINIGATVPQTALGTITAPSDGTGAWYNGWANRRNPTNNTSNGAISFDGADDYISIGSTVPVVNSVSLWIKPSSTTQSIIDLDGGSHKISISSGTVTATGFGSYYVDGKLSGTVPDTNWHQITAVSSSSFTTTTSIKIGAISSAYFSGLIDEVKIFNYALTAAQVQQQFNGGLGINFGN
jgi:hypothetical protein